MNIDQALIALCEKHDLSALSLGVSGSVGVSGSDSRPRGFYFSAYAHAPGAEGLHTYSAQAIKATASSAIAHAIQQVNEARACVVDVPAMELGEVVL